MQTDAVDKGFALGSKALKRHKDDGSVWIDDEIDATECVALGEIHQATLRTQRSN
jgi:Zn ribbon nucleic-acid-binding protein